jgi:hypothetical protein
MKSSKSKTHSGLSLLSFRFGDHHRREEEERSSWVCTYSFVENDLGYSALSFVKMHPCKISECHCVFADISP